MLDTRYESYISTPFPLSGVLSGWKVSIENLLSSNIDLMCVYRWLMLGGYTNVEGGPDTRPLDTVDLVTLDQEGECLEL